MISFLCFAVIVIAWTVAAHIQDGVLLDPLPDAQWATWEKFSPHHDLVELKVPSPSGIIITEHILNGTVIKVGRLRHSVLAIRTEWAQIHSTPKPILPPTVCSEIIEQTEEYAGIHGWTLNRHEHYPTTDIPVRNVFPKGSGTPTRLAIDTALQDIFKTLAVKFNLKEELITADDLFIAKYDATVPDRQRHLEPHQDQHLFSFVLALNEDFSEGGTHFFSTRELWRPSTGRAVLFHGMHWHAGHPINSGIRYIIAGFCNYGDDSHDQFMKLYQPEMDGFAASAGFRNRDIIRGVEECIPLYSDSSGETIRRILRSVDRVSGQEWSRIASSCEQLDPATPLKMIVERWQERPAPKYSSQ